MRNMSFSMTTPQIRSKLKTVTRRLGWQFLKPGEYVRPVVKAMGLKKGEKVEPIRGPLRIVKVEREWLWLIQFEGDAGTAREGFPEMTTHEFIQMFCDHMKIKSYETVTRIEFEYTD